MASIDSILKIVNSKGRIVYFLGQHSFYTSETAYILNQLLSIDDFGDESPEKILQKADTESLCFYPCLDPENIKPGEEDLFVDYGRKISSLPFMEISPIEKFNEDWGTTIVETDGQKYIDYGDGDPLPLIPWPEEFKNLLDKKEADFTTVLSLTEFILNKMDEMGGTVDFISDGLIIHCDEG